MKVFITGGAGFIGSNLSKIFIENNHEVLLFDSFESYIVPDIDRLIPSHTSRISNLVEPSQIVRGNMLNRYELLSQIDSFKPQIIVHAASLPLAGLSLTSTEEAYDSILTSTFNLLEIIRRSKIQTRLVFLSSSMVYGDFKTDPVHEDHKKNPKEIYGNLKLMAEQLIQAYAKTHNVKYTIIRPSAVYGPGDRNRRVIYKFIKAALSNSIISVDGDGENLSDFTHIDDISLAIYLASVTEEATNNVFNATTGSAISLNKVIEILRKSFTKLRVKYKEKPAHIPLRGSLDIGKISNICGYKPTHCTERGIEMYVEHLKNNEF